MYNLLSDPIIRIRPHQGKPDELSLPGVFAALARDEIASFPGLRPHQVPAWHMFLVQLAALALHGAGKSDLPEEAETWAGLLHGLTPDFPDDEPWNLIVEDRTKPAFMQAPEPSGPEYTAESATPDKIDMLETAKNHDVKQSMAKKAELDEWCFALVSNQTMNGNKSSKYKGIVRMNKGSSSRVCFSLTPLKTGHASISLGERFVWDVGRMVRNRERLECEWSGPEYAPAYGKALLWLFPWTSDEQLPIENFDPWFIEVCRRIRLTQVGDGLVAMTRTNTVNRTTGANLQGVTKDFWAPVNTVEVKSLTLSQSDFSFRNLEEFLLSPDWQLPLSVDIEGKDELQAKNWLFLAEAFARGNDKTYGFRRRELIMPAVIIGMASDQTGRTELSDHSKSLINDISVFSDAIEESIGLYIRGGVRLGDLPKENRKKAREKAQKAAKPCQARLDAEADRIFFDHLWKRASARREDRVRGDAEWSETAKAEREFRDALLTIARELLEEALDSLPCPAAYRYRARAKAEGRFIGSVYSHYPELKKVTEEAAEDAA